MTPATNEKSLTKNVKMAWSKINPDMLDNLISSMPERIKNVLNSKEVILKNKIFLYSKH